MQQASHAGNLYLQGLDTNKAISIVCCPTEYQQKNP